MARVLHHAPQPPQAAADCQQARTPRAAELGRQLARMHLATPQHDRAAQFGFSVDNTIGGTPQPNAWESDWVHFFREHRLRHQLKLAGNSRLNQLAEPLLQPGALETLFEGIEVKPSVLHGDLWSGNISAVDGAPCIFDPATYYGHHEAEWGMRCAQARVCRPPVDTPLGTPGRLGPASFASLQGEPHVLPALPPHTAQSPAACLAQPYPPSCCLAAAPPGDPAAFSLCLFEMVPVSAACPRWSRPHSSPPPHRAPLPAGSWCAGFGAAFWKAYHELLPRAPGFEARSDLYELYHKLNREWFTTAWDGSLSSLWHAAEQPRVTCG
jgi:hypothetical protein